MDTKHAAAAAAIVGPSSYVRKTRNAIDKQPSGPSSGAKRRWTPPSASMTASDATVVLDKSNSDNVDAESMKPKHSCDNDDDDVQGIESPAKRARNSGLETDTLELLHTHREPQANPEEWYCVHIDSKAVIHPNTSAASRVLEGWEVSTVIGYPKFGLASEAEKIFGGFMPDVLRAANEAAMAALRKELQPHADLISKMKADRQKLLSLRRAEEQKLVLANRAEEEEEEEAEKLRLQVQQAKDERSGFHKSADPDREKVEKYLGAMQMIRALEIPQVTCTLCGSLVPKADYSMEHLLIDPMLPLYCCNCY